MLARTVRLAGLSRFTLDSLAREVAHNPGWAWTVPGTGDYLVAAANRNGGADNITVVVVEVIGGWWGRLSSHWRRPFWGGRDAAACSAV